MDEGLFSSLGAASVVVLVAADAVRNDKNLKVDWTRRFKKGIVWAVLFSFIPAFYCMQRITVMRRKVSQHILFCNGW